MSEANTLLKGGKAQYVKDRERSEHFIRGKAQKKNVRQRKDYHNKRGTCWSRVYVYIRLDDITLPLDLGEYRFCLLGG